MSERDVVDAVEDVRWHRLHPADGDRPLRPAGGTAHHERVREHDRSGAAIARGKVGADAIHRGGQHGPMPGRCGESPRRAREIRFQVGDPIEQHRSVAVVEDEGPADVGDLGAEVQSADRQELGERAEPRRRVVIAGDGDDLRPGAANSAEQPRSRGDRIGRRHGTVVEIACDHDHVDVLGRHHVGDLGKHQLLVRQQALAVESAAQMPVGRVQQAHGSGDPTA